MAGHSKWANIQHRKGRQDEKRGRIFSRLAKEITVAARMGGGDLSGNARLRKAIDEAKGSQMPSDNITRAVKRGTGEIEGAAFEEVLYEGTGPTGTLFLVEGTTDNRNRSAAELRKIFEKHNGAMGGLGAAAWAFDRRGIVVLDKAVANEDQLMEIAVGGGADDYVDDGEVWTVYTPSDALDKVTTALEKGGIAVKSSRLGYVPKNKKEVRGRDAEVCLNLADTLDDHDDVQSVYADFDIPEDEMQRIAGAD